LSYPGDETGRGAVRRESTSKGAPSARLSCHLAPPEAPSISNAHLARHLASFSQE
jgi:hypothetical protein